MSGKFLAQSFAKQHFVIARGAVLFLLQRNQNLAVGGGDGGNVALRDGWASYSGCRCCRSACRSRRPGITARISRSSAANLASVSSMRVPAGTARVKPHLAGIHVGEKIFPDQPHQAERAECEMP